VKVNLGSGRFPLEGWTNVDRYTDADVQADFRTLQYSGVERVRMSHLLEHLGWRETPAALEHVRGWLQPRGRLELEVPDSDLVLAAGTRHPGWVKYVYGDQSHPGEYHQAGFTARTLARQLQQAGFWDVHVDQFRSRHKGREGMPCLKAEATA